MSILILLLVLVPFTPVSAQDVKPPASVPPPISVPEIPRRAEEATLLLRNLETETLPFSEIETVKRELSAVSATLTTRLQETKLILESEPALSRLDNLTDSWKSSRLDLMRSVELLRPQNRFDSVEWDLRLASGLPELRGDPGQLQQVLLNLFHNAADAMNDNGRPQRVMFRRPRGRGRARHTALRARLY